MTDRGGQRSLHRSLAVGATVLALAATVAGCGGDAEPAADATTPAQAATATAAPTQAATAGATPDTSPAAPQTPAAEGDTYTVQSGDTLSAIAQRFDTTIEALVEANDIDDPDIITVGQELVIP